MNKFPFQPFPMKTLKEAIKLLEFSLLMGSQVASVRDRVEQARDRLHDICREMERNGDAEERERVYLEAFDGLSFCTSALVAKPLNFLLIRQAVEKLRALRDLAVSS